MPDSNFGDGMSNVGNNGDDGVSGGKEPIDSPQVKLEDLDCFDSSQVRLEDLDCYDSSQVRLEDLDFLDSPQVRLEDLDFLDSPQVRLEDLDFLDSPQVRLEDLDFLDSPLPSDRSTEDGGGASTFTLSYGGYDYIFDCVSPDKLISALLILGGSEVPDVGSDPVNQQGSGGAPVTSDQQQRADLLSRHSEKKKERCVDKEIRDDVCKEVDLRCMHCGIGSKMSRGPGGSMTLCNSCGLKYSIKSLSKASIADTPESSAKESEQSGEEAKESDASDNVDGK